MTLNLPKYLSITFFICLLLESRYIVKADDPLNFSGKNIGLHEKGPYLGVFSNRNSKEQLELGISHIDIPIGKYDAGFSEKIKANLSFTGLKFLYRRFLKSTSKNTGPFLDLGLEVNRISAYSNIKLSKMTYKIGNISIRCPSCNTLDLSIKPSPLEIIPSLSIGWQYKITPRTTLKTSIGLQYKKIKNAKWNYNSETPLPFFVREEIDHAIYKINSDLKKLSPFYPSLLISISYELPK